MKQTMLAKFIGVFLLFVLLSQFVLAEFVVVPQGDILSCSCDVAQGSLYVRNALEHEQQFFISLGGSAAQFTTLYPSSFELGPLEETKIPVFVNSPCGDPASYQLDYTVKSVGEEKKASQIVSTGKCNNFDLRKAYENSSGCRCNTLTYGFWINNTGKYSETFTFSTTVPDYTFYPQKTAVLGPSEQGVFWVFVSPPCSQKAASFTFSVDAQESKIRQSVPLGMHLSDSCMGSLGFVNNTATSTPLRKYLETSLLFFPIVVIVLAIIVAIIVASRKGDSDESQESEEEVIEEETDEDSEDSEQLDEDIKKEKERYAWENKFSREEKEDEDKFNWKIALIIIALMAVIAVVGYASLKFAAMAKSDSTNSTKVIVQPNKSSVPSSFRFPQNYTLPDFGFSKLLANKSNSDGSMNYSQNSGNQASLGKTFIVVKSFISQYYIYFIIGFVVLLVIIAAFELFLLRKSDSDD